MSIFARYIEKGEIRLRKQVRGQGWIHKHLCKINECMKERQYTKPINTIEWLTVPVKFGYDCP